MADDPRHETLKGSDADLGIDFERKLEDRLEGRVRIGTSPLDGTLEDLFPEERVLVETSVASRQIEFASGRRLARRVMRELGLSGGAIERDADRVPIWPKGILGSISHTDRACVVGLSKDAALRGLGVDVEVDERRSRAFFERVTTPAERDRAGSGEALATRVFSVKEAVYKACYPAVREFWGFRDVEVELDIETGDFVARVPATAGGIVAGHQSLHRGRIWTVAIWS